MPRRCRNRELFQMPSIEFGLRHSHFQKSKIPYWDLTEQARTFCFSGIVQIMRAPRFKLWSVNSTTIVHHHGGDPNCRKEPEHYVGEATGCPGGKTPRQGG